MKNILQFMLLAALWGASFVFMKIGAQDFGSIGIIWMRVAIAAACLLPLIIIWRQGQWLNLKTWGILCLIGLFNSAIPFVSLAQATLTLQSGLVSILNASTLIFTAVIAVLWLDEAFSKRQIAGTVLGIAGLVILFYNSIGSYGNVQQTVWALILCLLAGLCYALAINLSKRYLPVVKPMFSAFISLLTSSVVLWLLGGQPDSLPTATQLQAPVILGVCSTAMAFVLYFDLIKKIGASKTASVTLVIPVFGVLWGMALLDETLSVTNLIGALCVICGAVLIHVLPRRAGEGL